MIILISDKEQLRAFVNTVMNRRLSQNTEQILST
jgi:hypothetical protein